jgi:hypothetical protein
MRRFSNYCEIFNRFEHKLCQTKPNSEMPKMLVTPVPAMTTNNEPPTMNYLKQSQTKPILPAYMAGKIVPSAAEGPYFSMAGKIALSAVEGPTRSKLESIYLNLTPEIGYHNLLDGND